MVILFGSAPGIKENEPEECINLLSAGVLLHDASFQPPLQGSPVKINLVDAPALMALHAVVNGLLFFQVIESIIDELSSVLHSSVTFFPTFSSPLISISILGALNKKKNKKKQS